MNSHKFDQIVEARANQRVQKNIEDFRRQVSEALTKTLGIRSGYGVHGAKAFGPDARKVMALLSGSDTTKGWPSALWEKERGAVSGELLATMDEMQKAFIAAGQSPGEDDSEMEMEGGES